MAWIKKLIKNKTVALAVCVIVVSLVYMGVQKAIDNYNFKNNNDIVVEESGVVESDGSNGESSEGTSQSESNENDENSVEQEGEISNEETDLVLEDVSNEDSTGKKDDSEKEDGLETSGQGDDANKIYVYITGEVNNPGVVVLNEGGRIVDAINAAGGTTAKANISKVNLVYVLDDGMKVNIPNNNDLKNDSDFEYITMNSGDGGNDDYSGSGSSTAGSSSGSSSMGAGAGGSGSEDSGSSKRYDIVNINTATQTELETLPGIGPSLALKIINHRKENGKFSSIEQIKDVSGIGESKFESLKSYITV